MKDINADLMSLLFKAYGSKEQQFTLIKSMIAAKYPMKEIMATLDISKKELMDIGYHPDGSTVRK